MRLITCASRFPANSETTCHLVQSVLHMYCSLCGIKRKDHCVGTNSVDIPTLPSQALSIFHGIILFVQSLVSRCALSGILRVSTRNFKPFLVKLRFSFILLAVLVGGIKQLFSLKIYNLFHGHISKNLYLLKLFNNLKEFLYTFSPSSFTILWVL